MKYYDIFPLVVRAGQQSEIRIRPRYTHAKFPESAQLDVLCSSYSGILPDETCMGDYQWANDGWALEHEMDGDTLVLRGVFGGEQEHNIHVRLKDDEGNVKHFRNFRIYSVKEDLYELRPYRGDFHIHTTSSDGREAPEYVAARYRQKGFDFVSISDHRQYQPSLNAMEYWKDCDLDFRLYPGEEVHADGNPVHIINFAGRESINEKCHKYLEEYRAEVNAILEAMPDKDPRVNNFAVASSEWVFSKIREAGGLAVFCHPYWFCERFVLNERITDEVFKRRKFDAFEVLGGHFKIQYESNNFQVVRYYEEQAKGNLFPVVGLSDSHGVDKDNVFTGGTNSDRDLFGWYYTVILSKSVEAADLIQGVRDFNSAAVSYVEGETARVYGSFRVTKYVQFLLREYFPMHDYYCAQEGAAMLDYLAGDPKAAELLKLFKGRTEEFRRKSFEG